MGKRRVPGTVLAARMMLSAGVLSAGALAAGVLAAVVLGGVLALSGCTGGGGSATDTDSATQAGSATDTASANRTDSVGVTVCRSSGSGSDQQSECTNTSIKNPDGFKGVQRLSRTWPTDVPGPTDFELTSYQGRPRSFSAVFKVRGEPQAVARSYFQALEAKGYTLANGTNVNSGRTDAYTVKATNATHEVIVSVAASALDPSKTALTVTVSDASPSAGAASNASS